MRIVDGNKVVKVTVRSKKSKQSADFWLDTELSANEVAETLKAFIFKDEEYRSQQPVIQNTVVNGFKRRGRPRKAATNGVSNTELVAA